MVTFPMIFSDLYLSFKVTVFFEGDISKRVVRFVSDIAEFLIVPLYFTPSFEGVTVGIP